MAPFLILNNYMHIVLLRTYKEEESFQLYDFFTESTIHAHRIFRSVLKMSSFRY